MRSHLALAVVVSCGLLWAQGPQPRKSAAEYPAHAALDPASIGAEYLVRSIPSRGRVFFSPEYLIVEVAVYPDRGKALKIELGHFALRMNGKKETIAPQSPGFIAAAFKYPDWEQRRRLEAIAGAGDGAVILGRPQPQERFPGDPFPGQTRLPRPPRAPEQEPAAEREQPARVEDVVVEAALPDVEASSPVAGYLYFPFKGKTKSIRSLELIYRGPAGTATLKFF
jgi:hypothetical protein